MVLYQWPVKPILDVILIHRLTTLYTSYLLANLQFEIVYLTYFCFCVCILWVCALGWSYRTHSGDSPQPPPTTCNTTTIVAFKLQSAFDGFSMLGKTNTNMLHSRKSKLQHTYQIKQPKKRLRISIRKTHLRIHVYGNTSQQTKDCKYYGHLE